MKVFLISAQSRINWSAIVRSLDGVGVTTFVEAMEALAQTQKDQHWNARREQLLVRLREQGWLVAIA